MVKHIYITNGVGGCGKDTFANFLNDFIPVYKYSSIDKVKEIARFCHWDGGKTEKDRKFLSDLKLLLTEYNDLPFRDIKGHAELFLYWTNTKDVMLIDIREPAEIERAKRELGAETILIVNPNIPHITSNMADKNVYEYEYDYKIMNDGTLEDFRKTVEQFARDRGLIQ